MNPPNPARRSIYQEIEQERLRQDNLYGPLFPDQRRHGHYTWNAILNKETGEASRALLQDDISALRKELVQCAAVVTAWIEFIDQNPDAESPAP